MKVESIWCVCTLEGAPRVWLRSCTRSQKAFKSEQILFLQKYTCTVPFALSCWPTVASVIPIKLGPLHPTSPTVDPTRWGSGHVTCQLRHFGRLRRLCRSQKSCSFKLRLCPGTVRNGSGDGSERFRRFSHPHCQNQDDVMRGAVEEQRVQEERASFDQRVRHHGRWMGPMLQWFEQIGKGQVCCQREDQDWCGGPEAATNKEEDCGILGPWNMFLNDYLMFVLLLNHTSLQAMVFHLEKLKVLTLK